MTTFKASLFFIVTLGFSLSGQSKTLRYTGEIMIGKIIAENQLPDLPPTIYVDGKNLPKGEGEFLAGKIVYETHCASCHGVSLEGFTAFNAPRLIGGRGSLKTDKPVKTVESFWPYAVTLFDYINRAMPFLTPKILTPDEVYAVTAYILVRANIIEQNEKLNESNLSGVKMPNQNGFVESGLDDQIF